MAAHRRLLGLSSKASGGRRAAARGNRESSIHELPSLSHTGRHWVEDDGAARLEATEKGLVEAIVGISEFRAKKDGRKKIKWKRDMRLQNPKRYTRSYHAGRLARSSVPAHRRAVRQEELDGERELPEVLTQVSEVRLDAVSSPQV